MIRSIFNEPGFFVENVFSKKDLLIIKKIIKQKLLKNIKNNFPKQIEFFKKLDLSQYHKRSDLIEHEKIMSRDHRLLSQNEVNIFFELDGIKKLKKSFKNFTITNEINQKQPEIVWRMVRPNKKNDVGPLHADSWFFDLNGWKIKNKKQLIKVWTLIEGDKKSSGLKVIPNSHKMPKPEYSSKDDFIKKPLIDEKKFDEELSFAHMEKGQSLIFHHDLIHGGEYSKESSTRISIEFTLEIDKLNKN